jgi:diguanylate cyclase (GGDEF)-like protein
LTPPEVPVDRQEVERLLEASLTRRGRRLPPRELRIELAFTALFLAGCGLLLVLSPGPLHADPAVAAMVVAYAVASRVDYPIATGVAVPTQPFLVALFVHAHPALVPPLAMGALALGTAWAAATGRARWDRLSRTGADAVHALGPALVLTPAGAEVGGPWGWTVVLAAFAAQCLVALGCSSLRDRLTAGVRPRIQRPALLRVWAVDGALTPIGVLMAAGDETGWAFLAMLPLTALMAAGARDRTDRTERLRHRLEALQRERRRLQIAVRRIGDAFASNLDLDALVEIVARTAGEALDAQGVRGSVVAGGDLHARVTEAPEPGLLGLLQAGEEGACAAGATTRLERGGAFVLAAPVGPADAPAAVVAVGRAGRPFVDEEVELFAYLCEQAAVSAANALRHETLHQQALTDELTGLANHRRLQEALAAATAGRASTGRTAALVLLDLDDFKQVNDRFGHQTGDLVLRRVGSCLRAVCREGDEPARYGGEELAVVLADADAERAMAFAERVRRAIAALPIQDPEGRRLPVTVSVGVAVAGPDAATPEALIAAADAALYAVKQAGKNGVRLGRRDPGGRRRREDLEPELREAVARGQLSLEYQPKVALGDEAVVGVEALLRWQHPRLGLLGPSRFLAYLEGTSLMPEVTAWVLEQALRQTAAWGAAGLHLPVSVNLTAEDLAGGGLPARLRRLAERTGARLEDLRVEVAEHAAMQAAGPDHTVLGELRALGVGVSLDDLGSGYTSLARLAELPVDELKLDGSLVAASDTRAGEAVLQAAIALGRGLGMTVVAEGVEDATQLARLRRLGCPVAQGYHVSPPLLEAELARWLATRPALSRQL